MVAELVEIDMRTGRHQNFFLSGQLFSVGELGNHCVGKGHPQSKNHTGYYIMVHC